MNEFAKKQYAAEHSDDHIINKDNSLAEITRIRPMTHDQLSRELNYRAAFSIAESLKKAGVLSPTELRHTKQLLRLKFSPPWGGLIR